MDKLKKVFSPGHSKDDEVMYGKTTDVPSGDQNTSTDAPRLETDPEAEKKSHGVLRQIFNPSGEKYSEQSYGTTATEASGPAGTTLSPPVVHDDASVLSLKSGAVGPYAGGADTPPPGSSQTGAIPPTSTSGTKQEDSSEWRDSTLAGIGAASAGTTTAEPHEHLYRENKGDDVSDSTYTARSYQLAPGVATEPQGPDRTVEPLGAVDEPQEERPLHHRDGDLTGAGTIIGAGTVSASALAAQEDKHEDSEVTNATYTARAFPVGGIDPAKVDFHDPPQLDTASRLNPGHIPGEFPTATGDDPHHVPGAYPETPAEPAADRELGSGTGVATGLGAGAVAGGVLGSSTTESTPRPGGEGSPIMTTTNSVSRAEPGSAAPQPESTHHYGRDAAIGGAVIGATGAAGYGIYEASKGDMDNTQTLEDRVVPQDRLAQTTQADSRPVVDQQPERQGRDPATIAAVTAATGAGAGAAGFGAYEYDKSRDARQAPQDGSVAGAQTAAQSASATQPTSSQVKPEESEPQHHYGRDAAIAGGATAATGAAGYGIYEATKDDDLKDQVPQERPPPQSAVKEPKEAKTTAQKAEPAKVEKAKPTKVEKEKEKPAPAPVTYAERKPVEPEAEENKYGRDAAIAGGATAATGAAGYGIYEATKDDPTDTGPASKTIGPHESNVANVLDPRVKPDPQKMKENESTTTTDSRVQSGPFKGEESQAEDNNYGRDAAIAGGAGAAGVAGAGAYEANRDRGDSTPTSASRTSHDSPNNKTSVDERGHTHLHKKSAEQQGEKKHGLVSRILHPNRTKREKEEREAGRRSLEQTEGYDTAHQQSEHIGTDGPIGDSHHVSGTDANSKSQAGYDAAHQQSEHIGTDGPIGDSHYVSGTDTNSKSQAGYDAAHQQSEHVGTDGAIGDSHHASGYTESKVGPTSGSTEPTSNAPATTSSTSATEPQNMITIHHEGADQNAPHVIVRDP